MGVYRLDPIDPNDPAWRRSSEKGALWVCALTPGKARILVANKTPEFLQPNPRGTFGTFSPWLHEHLATWVLDTSKGQIPDSTVKRAGGSVVRAPFNLIRRAGTVIFFASAHAREGKASKSEANAWNRPL